jgi:thiol-disulfide isomerase/thioredoxin
MERRSRSHKRSRSPLPLFIVGLGLVLLSLTALFSLAKSAATNSGPAQDISAVPVPVDYPAPEVALTDLDGRPVALSDYRGQVVLYNAWATWCPPCKAEMPILQAYYEAHSVQGFVVVAIEDGEPVQEVADYVRKIGLTFPVWPDPSWKATTAFRTNSLPASFVIDRGGTVRLLWLGAISRAMLDKYVTPLIQEN